MGLKGVKIVPESVIDKDKNIFEDEYETPDLEDFLKGVAKRFCPECGEAFSRNKMGRPKSFCSEKCRRLWWNKHERPENWKSTRKITCPVCGREFLAIRDYGMKRKYCSRACSNRARGRSYIENSNH